VWYLLTEYPVSKFLAEHDKGGLTGGLLFQKIQALGMSHENLESIGQMLAGFAQEALMLFKPGSPESPGCIRVFCQRKMIEAANSAQPAKLEPAEPAQKIHHAGTKMSAGWGCFLIKRGGNDSEAASLSSQFFVDLYLYREG
jgi:hypothetical protein